MNNLILIGFKSAGKTTLGKRVAAKLRRPFIDTDTLFDAPPAELYRNLGPNLFRAQEKKLLLTLAPITNHVIATGGGTPCDPESAQFLRQLGLVIHLQTPKTVIEERLGLLPPPPCLQGDSFERLYAERLSTYIKVAHHTFITEAEIWKFLFNVTR